MNLKRLAGTTILAVLLLVIAFVPAQESTAQVNTGTNWQAQFFNDASGIYSSALSPVAVNVYPSGLQFNWPDVPRDSFGQPVLGVNADNFSVLFTTQFNFLSTGNYQFYGNVDDEIVVAIDGFIVFQQTTPGNFSFQYNLTTGLHTVAVGLVDRTAGAVLSFQWQFVGTGAIGTPVPFGPQGHVVNVRGLSLRTGPYLGGSFIGILRPDNLYTVLGKSDDEGGGYTWFYVIAGEKEGWTSGRYFSVDADLNSIPYKGNIFQQLDAPNPTGVIGMPRAVMNFRRRPSVRATRIGQIPWGAEVEILNRTIQAGKNHWFQVKYNNQIGWIYAPYVAIRRGFLETVPIR